MAYIYIYFCNGNSAKVQSASRTNTRKRKHLKLMMKRHPMKRGNLTLYFYIFFFSELTCASAFNSISTSAGWLCSAARCRAVYSLGPVVLGSNPLASSTCTRGSLPLRTARCKAVDRFGRLTSSLAFLAARTLKKHMFIISMDDEFYYIYMNIIV